MKRVFLSLFLASVFTIGCSGSGPTGPDPTTGVTTTEELKKQLEEIAKNGSTGSATAGIPELVGKLGDPALTESAKLLAETEDPEVAKKTATEMLQKLPASAK